LILDAVGLALFAVIGAQKAINYGINPLMSAIIGMLTGIGGGMTRDVLAGNVPFVLRGDLYASGARLWSDRVDWECPWYSSALSNAAGCRRLCVPTAYGDLSRLARSHRQLGRRSLRQWADD